jgi:hypothetical protein
MGLAGRARDLLLESNIAAFGAQGTALELELLLKTGRARQIVEWVDTEHESMLGKQHYHLVRTMALAALGDYGVAQNECNQLCGSLATGARAQEAARSREIMALMVGKRMLEEQTEPGSVPQLAIATMDRYEFRVRLDRLAQSLHREAEMTVFRGLLALEEGNVAEAEIAFNGALLLWKDEATEKSGGGLDFKGRVVAQGCLEWLK